ncbi:TIGR03086 family protein [Streptomyces agglomeratus]|uniref:TIGR03086 family protein n=1 Tax=Streptomyces agglomeratus TaxID=285458 RepID=A0A1E5PD63_9ACTN|nr:TIGR03086 family metal-binding protein [Streptomyces agglomeratus]OEJ27479.1 TIGR03086 family protein [Streptomyces agglomeratus]OEJ38464.1 TIGR03086 family protein [Streptomyces agglomeratus]OEJ47151.1 TIGR03086 family protein [Streptomyces agglomeratus]OEJ50992.1 TIGR03086 family protein [Streptomyces agglomeratus]OEJ58362.1 TIGR03086 family protein [Streptomyces agglomeratus]
MTVQDRTPYPLDFEPAARRVVQLLDGVTDDRLSAPTPCEKYAVHHLLAHLVGLTAAFRDAARKKLGPTTDTAPDAGMPVLADDWRTRLPRQLDELVAAWRDPDAWQGTTRAGGVTLPAEVAGRVALNEVVLHGWDLARATGQVYSVDDASLRSSYELLEPTGDAPDDDGIFGVPVEVPEDAPLLDRVVGRAGRSPSWPAG